MSLIFYFFFFFLNYSVPARTNWLCSVDWETEARMLDIIETECATQTVIAVMHRLRHVERLDRIAVLQDGQLIEFDAPDRLLARESRFRELYTMSSRGV